MEEIKRKLCIIEKIWCNRFWDYDYLLKEIKFDKNLTSNFPGVALGYLGDTMPIIDKYLKTDTKMEGNCFLSTIGILQVIYIQQDLIDELLQVFRLQKSSLVDKNPNRTIRNDLAGHPIRRQRAESEKGLVLKSFSLFSYEATREKIQYPKYRRETNFAFELEEHNVTDVIKRHKEFLVKYLNLIFQRVIKILKNFNKVSRELLSIQKKINFTEVLLQVKNRFNHFFKIDNSFDEKFINKCWDKKEQHPRYQYAVDKFNKELSEMIICIINSVEQTEKEWNKSIDEEIIQIEDFLEQSDNINITKTAQIYDHYELSKLYDNHPIFGIDYFKKKFDYYPEIIEELNNMEKNTGSNEFYCSYNYLYDVLFPNLRPHILSD